MSTRVSLGDMLRAGWRACGRYTGTLLTVFVAQSLVALACMFGVSFVLSQTFATLPMWDEAVDGDLVALLWCFHHGENVFLAVIGIVLGATLVWQLMSWFVVGGINGVLSQRPEGRADTARCFGAGGTATYLAYARLALLSIPGWILVLWLFFKGIDIAGDRYKYALTMPQLVGPYLLATLPALILLHVMWTITDYARVELSLRHESHDPSVVMTYVRSLVYVLKRPITLLHAGVGWLAFAFVTVGYAWLAHGHPMYGADGAVTLFVIRQGVALLRTAIRFGVIGGQVELGKTRALPPRRVEVKADTKKG